MIHKKKTYGLAAAYAIGVTLCPPLFYLLFMADGPSGTGGLLPWARVLLLLAYGAALLVLAVKNMVQAIRVGRSGEAETCVKAMAILKYGLAPFVVFHLALLAACIVMSGLLGLGMVVASRGFLLLAAPFLVPYLFLVIGMVVFLTWAAIIPGAFYGVYTVVLSYRAGKLSLLCAILNGAAQLIPLLDVISAMYLAGKKWRMGRKSALAVVLVCIAMLVLLFL